jgi:hypothetical protein
MLPVLDLPAIDLPAQPGAMLWGDGFEIETVINCRMAAAGVLIAEVPSVERRRIHGESNLRTFADGSRVLRTILAERRRQSQRNLKPQVMDDIAQRRSHLTTSISTDDRHGNQEGLEATA